MSPSAEGRGLRSIALAVVGAVLVVVGLVLTFVPHDVDQPDRAVTVSSDHVHHASVREQAAAIERIFGLHDLGS